MVITAKKIRPFMKVLLLVALLAAAGYIFYFVQFIFYPALTGSETVFALQKSMGIQTVDLNKFNSLVGTISQKNSAPSAPNLPANPFK